MSSVQFLISEDEVGLKVSAIKFECYNLQLEIVFLLEVVNVGPIKLIIPVEQETLNWAWLLAIIEYSHWTYEDDITPIVPENNTEEYDSVIL